VKEVTKNMRSSEVLSMMEEVYESKKIGEVRYDSSSNDIIFFFNSTIYYTVHDGRPW